MKSVRNLFVSAIVALVLPATAHALEYTRLFAHKAWTVDITVDDDGQLFCSAETWNREGDLLSVSFWDDGAVSVYANFKYKRVGYGAMIPNLHIDYSSWELLNTNANGNSVFSHIRGTSLGQFMSELQSGRAVAFKSASGGNFAAWSLAGSHAAITKLGECAYNIGWRF
jgi:hypothetical protein